MKPLNASDSTAVLPPTRTAGLTETRAPTGLRGPSQSDAQTLRALAQAGAMPVPPSTELSATPASPAPPAPVQETSSPPQPSTVASAVAEPPASSPQAALPPAPDLENAGAKLSDVKGSGVAPEARAPEAQPPEAEQKFEASAPLPEPTPTALPSPQGGVQARILIRYSGAGGRQRAEEFARTLKSRGFDVVAVRETAAPLRTSLAFYYAPDKDAAEAVGRTLGIVPARAPIANDAASARPGALELDASS